MIEVSGWLVIDAVLDNAVSVATQSGLELEDATVTRASRLRRRGWDAAAAHPLREGPAGWPPRDAQLDIDLSDADRAFLRAKIDDALDITRGIIASPELHPEVRVEQQDSLEGLVEAQRVLARGEPVA